ncbi:MAG TPA: sulfite exporter TauE/SafE family protein [Coriobacteriia bacterium]|nr:sulfite exporter TauE/SafE family protein [Coriobacteriia bacterium]
MTTTFIIYMFTLGLGTSLHCVSMCGPLVLTYAVKGTEDGPWYSKLTPNFAYQGAKLVSYMLVGLLLGSVGAFLNIDALRPYIMFLAGVFMIVLGLGMTGKVPWAARLTPRPPQALMNAIVKLRRKSTADAKAGESTIGTPIFFGLMTGLLPCGPLMAAQVSAAASGSAAAGALGMAAFAVGTAPLMIAFGTAGSLIPRAWKQRMMTVLAVGVMVFGLVFINRGLMLTGAPVNFNTVKGAFIGTQTVDNTTYQTGEDGVVEIPLVIENTQFSPTVVSIPADKPVRLVVERREENACSDQLALPQLGVLADLAPNAVTTVELPAAKAGNYTLTCGMGMMSGQLSVGGGAGSSGSPLPWLLLAVAGAGGALFITRRRSLASQEAARQTKGAKGSTGSVKGAKPAASPAAAPALLLGFKPNEVVLIGAAVALAVMAGLVIGGAFS